MKGVISLKIKAKQILAVIFLAVFVFFCVFSAVGLVTSVHHSCAGIHCRVCEKQAVIENVFSMLKAVLIVFSLLVFSGESIKLLASKLPAKFNFFTTVTLKTKLSM